MINSLRHTTQNVIALLIMLVDFLRVFITVYTLKQNVCEVKMVTYRCLSPILIICESVIKQAGPWEWNLIAWELVMMQQRQKIVVQFNNTKCLEWNWTYCMVNKYCCITNILMQNLFLSLCVERMSKRNVKVLLASNTYYCCCLQ